MKYALITCAVLATLLTHCPRVNSAPTYNVETESEKQWISEGIQKFIEHLQQQYEELSKNAHDESLPKLIQHMKELQQIRDILETKAATQTMQNIRNFISLVKVFRINVAFRLEILQEEVKLRTLYNLQTELDNIDRDIQSLEALVLRIKEHQENDIQRTHNEILQQWNGWASKQVERTALATKDNTKSLNQAKILVNDLVNAYTGLVNSCTSQSLNSLAEYENAVNEVIERYRSVLVETGFQTGKCLQADDDDQTAEECNAVVLSAKPLSEAAVGLATITYEGVKFLSNRLMDSSCVIKTLIDFRIRASTVERKINLVILKTSLGLNNEAASDASNQSSNDSDESNSISKSNDSNESNSNPDESTSDSSSPSDT